MKRLYIGVGALLIVIFFSLLLLRGGGQGNVYETMLVDRGNVVERITATGTVNPVTTVRVGSQVSGRIAKLFADYNSRVTRGEIVAQLETDIYQSRVEQAQANYRVAQARKEEARVALADAENNVKRVRNLQKERIVSERELEIAETNWEAARASLVAAEASEAQARAQLNAARVDLEHTTIFSPVDGIVISRNCDVGQTVVANFQTPDLFLIAKDLTKMQVEAYVDEADIGKVQVGQEVWFTVDAFPENVFKGKVSQVRFAPKEEQNVVTYTTVVEVDNPDLKLRPGMTASVSFITAEREQVLRVPTIALRFKPDPRDKKLFQMGDEGSLTGNSSYAYQRLWIINGKGKVDAVSVRVGISDGHRTEIVEGPLKGGEKVIIGYLNHGRRSASSKQPSGFRFRFGR